MFIESKGKQFNNLSTSWEEMYEKTDLIINCSSLLLLSSYFHACSSLSDAWNCVKNNSHATCNSLNLLMISNDIFARSRLRQCATASAETPPTCQFAFFCLFRKSTRAIAEARHSREEQKRFWTMNILWETASENFGQATRMFLFSVTINDFGCEQKPETQKSMNFWSQHKARRVASFRSSPLLISLQLFCRFLTRQFISCNRTEPKTSPLWAE